MKFSGKATKISLAIICSLVCILLLIWLATSFFLNRSDDDNHQLYQLNKNLYEWELKSLGEEAYYELNEICSDEDIKELQPLLDDIEHAFSSIYSTREEAKKDLGEVLCIFAHYSYYYDVSIAREEHEIHFITGKVSGDNAYVWLEYWERDYDSNGKRRGSGPETYMAKLRITAEKQNGKWVATKALSPP